MRFKFIALISTIAVVLLLSGCDNAENRNITTNTNANANANTPLANANTMAPNTNANDTAGNRHAPTREEYERDKERYSREAKESGRTIGTGLNDGWLWVKTRFELAGVDDLRDSTINVDVDNAVVTLSGSVASAAQKTRADQTAKAVEGVKSVKNMLKVVTDNSNTANANTKAKAK